MKWENLTDLNQLTSIITLSKEQHINAVLLFKHSTRCSISSMALSRLENKWINQDEIPTYYLDLLEHRDISNEIASLFGVEHASPQVLLIKNGMCFYHDSHTGISVLDITDAIAKQNQ